MTNETPSSAENLAQRLDLVEQRSQRLESDVAALSARMERMATRDDVERIAAAMVTQDMHDALSQDVAINQRLAHLATRDRLEALSQDIAEMKGHIQHMATKDMVATMKWQILMALVAVAGVVIAAARYV